MKMFLKRYILLLYPIICSVLIFRRFIDYSSSEEDWLPIIHAGAMLFGALVACRRRHGGGKFSAFLGTVSALASIAVFAYFVEDNSIVISGNGYVFTYLGNMRLNFLRASAVWFVFVQILPNLFTILLSLKKPPLAPSFKPAHAAQPQRASFPAGAVLSSLQRITGETNTLLKQLDGYSEELNDSRTRLKELFKNCN